MISFNPSNDIDLKWYQYRVYTQGQIVQSGLEYLPVNEGSYFLEGYSISNVFTVDVLDNSSATPNFDGSTTTNNVVYYAKVRSIDTSGNASAWTGIASSAATPLIKSAHIANLTAGKITSGTINAAEITLNGATSILKSSNYAQGQLGWKITGLGDAEFNNLTVRTALDIGGDDISSFHVDIDGNMWSGASIAGKATAPFRVSNAGALTASSVTISGGAVSGATVGGVNTSSDKLFLGVGNYNNNDTPFFVGLHSAVNKFSLGTGLTWDSGTQLLTINGNGTFSGNISAATGTFTGNLQIGSGENVFKVDSNGIYLGNETFANAEFRVTPAGSLTATSGTVGGWTLGSTSLSASYNSGGLFSTGGSMTLLNDGTLTSTYVNNTIFGTINTTVKINDYGASGQGSVTVEGNASGSNSKYLYSASGPFNISDSRLKNVINSTIDGLAIVNNVNVVKFNYKNDENQKEHIGFIAQQVYEHIPESAFPGGEDEKIHPWMMSKESLIPYLTRSIQQLSIKVDELESRLV